VARRSLGPVSEPRALGVVWSASNRNVRRRSCRKLRILEHARRNNVSKEALQAIEKLPSAQYTSMADVFKGVGEEKR